MTQEGQLPNIRYVRCPKCRNLLPEYPDLSIYRCGICGVVLQAKRRALASGGSVKKSETGSESKESSVVKDLTALGIVSERKIDRIENVSKEDTDFAGKIDLDSSPRVADKERFVVPDKDAPNRSSLVETIGGKGEGDEMGSERKESSVVKDLTALNIASEREIDRIENVSKEDTDFAEKIDLDSSPRVADKERFVVPDKDAPNRSSLVETIGGKGEGDEMGSERKESSVVKGLTALNIASEREIDRIENVSKEDTDFAEKIDLDSSPRVVDKERFVVPDKDAPNRSSLVETIGGKGEERNVDEDNGHAEHGVTDGKVEQTSVDEDMGFTNKEDADGGLGREIMGRKVEQSSVDEDIGHVDEVMQSSKQKQPIGSGAEGDNDGIKDRDEYVDLRIRKGKGKMKFEMRDVGRFPRIATELDAGNGGFEGVPKGFSEIEKQGKFRDSGYSDEGPSNYHLGYASGFGIKLRDNDTTESTRIKNLERDRVELLRKLNELKDQLSKPLHVEKVPVGENIVPLDTYGSHEKVRYRTFIPEKQVAWTPYIDGTHGPVPSMNAYERDVQSLYHFPRFPSYSSNNVSEGQLPPHMVHRYPGPWQYPLESFQNYHYPRPPHSLYSCDYPLHTSLCTDLYCSCQIWQKSLQFPPSIPVSKRYPKGPRYPNFHHPATFDPWSYSPRSANPHLHFHGPLPPQSRELRDDLRKLKKPIVIPEEIQHCHPVADGAPFITCCNCLALLKLPKKFINVPKDRQKLRCGSCLSINVIETDNGRLVVSVLSSTKLESVTVNDGSVELLSKNGLTSYGFPVSGGTKQSLSYPASKDEESPVSVLVQGKVVNSSELLGDCASPTVSEPQLLDFNHELNIYALGNSSKHLDREELFRDLGASHQYSMDDFSLATELDVSYYDYRNTSLSKDGTEVIKEEGRTKNKRNESFFSSFFKKSLRDFSRSSRSVRKKKANVVINGRVISDHDIGKAERVAGEIRPGEYWYDYRAGFWGVIGQPCLGIIPPHIQEFNYPMPSNCGAGDTGVYVNGRELHLKDLEMLANRGLPTTRNKSYLIDISGRVVDEVSGLELDRLGKIAPTVEKLNRGFGMRVPDTP